MLPEAAPGVEPTQFWHLLQVSDVLDIEFASALAEKVSVVAWEPQRMLLPFRVPRGREAEVESTHVPRTRESSYTGCSLRLRKLPLVHGFSRSLLCAISRTQHDVLERLLMRTPDPQRSPLICSTPYFAGVAERWPGPVVYWLTDLIAEYASADRSQVIQLDRRMCRRADLVCPNSQRLQHYLEKSAACEPDRIAIVPNATREVNLLSEPPEGPSRLPPPLDELSRPVAGVIGNLAGNMDWLLIQRTVELTPWLSWVFVGPTSMHMADAAARRAREWVMAYPGTHFVGKKAYGELAGYARAFDVAVLPYLRCEPTYSGSSTRFYEHLAACRPMIATPGLEELTRKVPLLTLVETAEQTAYELEKLRTMNFDDGLTHRRWTESLQGTWSQRASTVQRELAARTPTGFRPQSLTMSMAT